MLILTRKLDPSRDLKNKLILTTSDGPIVISIQSMPARDRVVLGIEAPESVGIVRKEKIRQQRKEL